MNLKEALKNLTDKELNELLDEIINHQMERAREEETPLHYYTFSGKWSFGCWARSQEEAEQYMEEATIELFDLDLESVEMEVNDD